MGSAQGKGDEKSDDPNLTDKQLADEVEEEEKKDDHWLYELTLQYLQSPVLLVPVYSFIDENCIFFDEDEVNQHEQKSVFDKF